MPTVINTAMVFGLLLTISGCQSSSPDLLTAIQNKDVEVVRQIIAKGVDLDPISRPNEVNKPLAYAAAYGNLEIVKLLVEAGANLNGQVAYGDVALTKADEHRNEEIIEYLIEQGADVNIPNAFGVSPFIGLCGQERLSLVKLAAEHGGNVNSSFVAIAGDGAGKANFSPLQAAAFYGRRDAVELLLSLGADPRAKDSEGKTSLDLAKSRGHKEVSELLQKHLDALKD